MIKKILGGLLIALALVVAVLITNTLLYTPGNSLVTNAGKIKELDVDNLARNLSRAVQFKTVSHQNPADFERSEFEDFLAWLEETYPRSHATMQRTLAGGLTPLYKWQGADDALLPVIMTGHYDVVPAPDETLASWSYPPFSGEIAEGFVWGRGTLDDKIAVLGLLEAAEHLIAEGFQPKRTIYFSFGHDEEVGGWQGAGRVAHMLKKQGVEMEWSLDEGSMVLDGILPGIKKPIASINVAEKGYVTLDIKAKAQGGHSSLPPPDTAVGRLSRAIKKLEENPVPGGLTGVSAEFFDAIAPNFPFIQRMLFANRWLFGPLLEGELSKSAATNAMLRTTTAPTMLSASVKENVLPTEATAAVNFRIHPRDTVNGVLGYVKGIIDDPQVEVSIRGENNEASAVSDHRVQGYRMLSSTFREVFGDLIVVPGLTIAATDTKHYSRISQNSYRINPLIFGPTDIPRIHGINERVSLENIELSVNFYIKLFQNIDKPS
ncbi:MAG: M20 family peptidase [Pseudomonadota bacterium]